MPEWSSPHMPAATYRTALSVALFIPAANHLTGQRQDMSVFAGLQGNLEQLVMLLALSWTLAAVGEEVDFRGYLLTRLTEVLGTHRGALVRCVLVSSINTIGFITFFLIGPIYGLW